MKYIKLFENHSGYEDFVSGGTMLKPNVSHCVSENEVHYNPFIRDYSKDYLTIKALSDGTLGFHPRDINSFEYSLDGGQTWNTATAAEAGPFFEVTLSRGDEVCFKKEPSRGSQLQYYGNFYSTCQFEVYGNILSMVYGTGFVGATTISSALLGGIFADCTGLVNAKNLVLAATTLANYCYQSMFEGCTSLTTAPELPATTLAESCYSSMFRNCTSLTTAPELPATTLAEGCYRSMFNGCTNLTTAPELPATTLAVDCYSSMFRGCTRLTTAPELLATTLRNSCYTTMFYGCTSLVNAPELPATTLVSYCYYSMFEGCTSLTTAPELPATTLANSCYTDMFNGCSNLNYIKAMFTTTPSGGSPYYYTQNWVSGVASNGTFVKNAAATWTDVGIYAVPTGWAVETASA